MTRRFPTLTLLEASQNYEAMFTDILKSEQATEKDRAYIADAIKWARRVLKKQDRIVWWLRYVKAVMLGVTQNSDKARMEAGLEFIRQWDPKTSMAMCQTIISETGGRDLFEHWFSLDYVKIQNYVFGNQPYNDLRRDLVKLEREYIERANAKIKHDDPSLEGTSILLDCGDNWFWVSLNRAACSAEGRAMGHCGNSPRSHSDDNILSLRKFKERRDGTSYWEPHLTFTINEGGELQEMKGRGNQKPAAQYNPMIVKLLLHRNPDGEYLVQELKGGEWLPENDFALEDLGAEVSHKILKQRPELGELFDYIQYGGDPFTSTMTQKLHEYFWSHPLSQFTKPNWYDWSVRDGKLYYNLPLGYSELRFALLEQWEGRSFSTMFNALDDDPIPGLTLFTTEAEEARIRAAFAAKKDEIAEFRKRERVETTRKLREMIDARFADMSDIVEIEWPTAPPTTPVASRSLPVLIKDPVGFVNLLRSRLRPPMRDFIFAVENLSSSGGQVMKEAKALDNQLDIELNRLLRHPQP